MLAKNKKKKSFLLIISVVFHLFSCFCSVYGETGYADSKWPGGYKDINYWLNFFSWWCAYSSLTVLIYFIYQLFKKSPSSYFDKIFSLVVVNSNVITILIFTLSAPLLAPRHQGYVKIFSWEINRKIFWWFYAIIWHYLAPILAIIHFARRKNELFLSSSVKKKVFFWAFFHAFFYFLFVLARPLIPGSEKYLFSGKPPQNNYPYFWFCWVEGWSLTALFWFLVIISFWLIIFWFSSLFFWKISRQKKKSFLKNSNSQKDTLISQILQKKANNSQG